MTLRFVGSTIGYFLIIIFTIAFVILSLNPWPFKIFSNLIFAALNLTANFQAWGFRPMEISKSSKKSTKKSSNKSKSKIIEENNDIIDEDKNESNNIDVNIEQ